MGSQYYLVASLPRLVLGQRPPFDEDRFLSLCEGVLSPSEQEDVGLALAGLGEDSTTLGHHPFLHGWRRSMIQMRNALACSRAHGKHVDAATCTLEHTGYSGYIQNVAAHAVDAENPRDAEMELDLARWKMVEELLPQDPFDFAVVLAFAVRLRLAWRWARMDETVGRKNVEDMVAARSAVSWSAPSS
ncbi:DUF2764 family protein [Desulfovibrio inopinatus]|uniref:DUF2764 family protein n=1 Tax=Desulfovibrio inopinatus TaxID=102109 RepID=UPI00040908B6|nr:DUF2764 family protein [Desulfovibrio inopinatus]